MSRAGRRRKRRAVVDTNVLIAGIAGLRPEYRPGINASADLLLKWAVSDCFTWLYSEEILEEYKDVMRRLHVRPQSIGRVINLIREGAEKINVRRGPSASPDPG